ncbi:MAG: hypothetical protein ACREB3_05945, partial [Burkholderiales bacterium]
AETAADLDAQRKDLASRQIQLEERANDLVNQRGEFRTESQARDAQLTAREAAIGPKETELNDREVIIKRREDEQNALQSRLDAKARTFAALADD